MTNNFGTRCPKCDYSSSNPEVCDACGALITRIRAREIETDDGSGYLGTSHGSGSDRSWTKLMLALVIFLAIAAFAFLKYKDKSSHPIDSGSIASVFTENFDSEVENYTATPVLIDFYATWCGPCKDLAPRLEQLASDYSTKLKVVKVDIDRDPELAQRYRVQGVPTLVLVKGGSEVTRTIGALPLPQLKSRFDPHL